MAEDHERSPTPTSAPDESDGGTTKRKPTKRRRLVVYKLSTGEQGWIKPNFNKFVMKIGRRGAKGDTARAYCTNNIAPRFMLEFHKDADPDDDATKKTQYEADYSIYVYLSNLWKRERRRIKKFDGPKDGSTKFHPQYYWAEVHGEEITAEIERKLKDQPGLEDDIGLWRRTVSELFKAQSFEEQGKWKSEAEREKAKHAVAANSKEPFSDKEKMIFIKDWCKQMENLVKLGEARGGIQSLVHFGTPDVKEVNGEEKKVMKFTSYTSKQSSGYTRTKDFNDGEEKFGDYVAENIGARAERGIPIAVTPADDGAPVIPDLPDNPVLSLLRTLLRPAFKAHWRYAAGQGAVPWTEISQAIAAGSYVWIAKERFPTELLPSGKRVRFCDPGELTIDECLIWLRHLKRRQQGEPDTSTFFQFQQAYTIRTHVFPEWTKMYSQKPTRRVNADVLLVKYKGYLDRPETYDPILYDDNSWQYFYRDTGKAGLIHWKGLPSRPKAPIPPQVSASEIEVYQYWFDSIKETQKDFYDRLFSTIDLVNRLDRGVPLMAQDELWCLANEKPREVPLAIPSSPPSTSSLQQWLSSPWIDSYLFAPHEVERTGSSTLFEDWQHRMRSGPLYHPLSKTFRGGRYGVVWVIRGVLKHLATVGAAAGVLKLPKNGPPGSDFGRLTLSDWNRATTWLEAWHALLEVACETLESTLRERQKPARSPSSEGDDRTSIKDGGAYAPNDNHAIVPNDDLATPLSQPRTSLPRKAKSLTSYLDPYLELDEDRPEPEESEISSGSDGEASDEDDNERLLESKLPPLLQAATVKSGNYDERRCVFGPEPKAKRTAPFPLDPDKIREGVDAYFETTSDLFSAYKSLKFENGLPYTTKLRDWIFQHASSLEEPRRHLVSTILLQRLTWRQAQVVWPNAEAQYREFQAAFRLGSALLVAIKGVKDEGMAGSNMDDIITREDELTARVWTTRLVFEQFSAFSVLSLKYANKLRDRFLTVPLNAKYSELEYLVAIIRDWRRDYSEVVQGLRNHRKTLDEQYQLDDYVPHVRNSWFWYGNPSGFVLSAKAEELVQDIPSSTEIDYESDDGENRAIESPGNTNARGEAGDAVVLPGVETAKESVGGEERGGNGDEGSPAQGISSAKKYKRPTPKPKPELTPDVSPTPTPTPTLPTTTSVSTTASSPIPPHQLTPPPPQRSSIPSQPTSGSNLKVTIQPKPSTLSGPASSITPEPLKSQSPGLANSSGKPKGKTKLTPTIELPKPKAKVNRKVLGSAGVGKPNADVLHESARINDTAPPPPMSKVVAAVPDEPVKKRRASTEASDGSKRHKADKASDNGEGGETNTMDPGLSTDTGRPRRIRVPSARARGVA